MASGFIPSGEDRAIGTGIFPGTPTPAGVIVQSPSGTFLQEESTSPSLEAGEQGTIVHEFTMDQVTGLNTVNANPRGTINVDSVGIVSKVLSTSYTQLPGNLCRIRMTSEDLNFTPPMEFRVEAVEFNPSLFRHPRYQSVVNYSGVNSNGGAVTGADICAVIQGASQLPQVASQAEAQNRLTSDMITNGSVLTLAQELFGLIQQGFDTFYLAGFKVTWSRYDFLPIEMNPGGYIQDPVSQGGLPATFWSTTGAAGGNNILTSLAATVAPALYSGGLSWLRQSDDLQFERTWFKLTSIWLGGPLGHWNSIIYGSGN